VKTLLLHLLKHYVSHCSQQSGKIPKYYEY
jgi:hypothetical protein